MFIGSYLPSKRQLRCCGIQAFTEMALTGPHLGVLMKVSGVRIAIFAFCSKGWHRLPGFAYFEYSFK